MRLLTLGLAYAALGLCLAVVRFWRGPRAHRRAEAVLLTLFWPLYAPFCFASRLVEADPLARRLARAEARAREIDRLLATPDFDAQAVLRRADTLEAAGQPQAAAAARRVLGNIRRLQAIRRRYAEELAVVEALQHQLRTQAQLMRLAGQPQEGLDDLVGALEARVEALEEVLAEPVG
jgi:hypothetical protein